jgi:hypothetical protein
MTLLAFQNPAALERFPLMLRLVSDVGNRFVEMRDADVKSTVFHLPFEKPLFWKGFVHPL